MCLVLWQPVLPCAFSGGWHAGVPPCRAQTTATHSSWRVHGGSPCCLAAWHTALLRVGPHTSLSAVQLQDQAALTSTRSGLQRPHCLPHPCWSARPLPAHRKCKATGSAAHSPLRPSPRETWSGGSALPATPRHRHRRWSGAHVTPWLISCFLLPPPLSCPDQWALAHPGPPSRPPQQPGSQAPSVLHPLNTNTKTQSAVLLCPGTCGPTNLPTSLPNLLPATRLRFRVGKGPLAASPMRVPPLRLSTWSLGLAPWASPEQIPCRPPGHSLGPPSALCRPGQAPVPAWAGPCALAPDSSRGDRPG